MFVNWVDRAQDGYRRARGDWRGARRSNPRMQARTIDVDGPAYVLDYAGPAGGPTFVLVHGLGGSHVNWMALAPLLAQRGRVLVPDLPGFGRTPPEGRAASVRANRAFVSKLIQQEAGTAAVLVGNSMGGLISIVQAADEPEAVAGLVLIDPAIPRRRIDAVDATVARLFATYLVPRVGEAFIERRPASMGPERLAEETLKMCTVDP